jgi:hypothetical protein
VHGSSAGKNVTAIAKRFLLRQHGGRAQRRSHYALGRRPRLLAGKVPEPVAGVAQMDVAFGPQADPQAAGRRVVGVERAGRPRQLAGGQIFAQRQPRQPRGMQLFRRALPAPREVRKHLRRIADRARLVLHVIDEIVPDVGHRLDVIAPLLHAGEAAVPAEAHEEDAAFDADAGLLEVPAGEVHRRARADRIVEHDGGLVPVDRSLDELERAVLLALRANQQAVIAAARLQDAGIENRHRGQADRGDLPAVEPLEQLEDAAAGELGAVRGERHLQRIEHPLRRGAVAREDRLGGRLVEDRLAAHRVEELRAIGVELRGKTRQTVGPGFHQNWAFFGRARLRY